MAETIVGGAAGYKAGKAVCGAIGGASYSKGGKQNIAVVAMMLPNQSRVSLPPTPRGICPALQSGPGNYQTETGNQNIVSS